MTTKLAVAVAVLVAAVPVGAAGGDGARAAGREKAPRLLKDAVASGTVEAGDFAAIVDWILHEKEENVAAGLLDLLGAAEPAIAGAGGPRWEPTTRAVFALFGAVLRDAEGNRRRGGRDLEPEIAAVVSAAAPAVAATLQEADPQTKARMAQFLEALAPLEDDLTALVGPDATARAREALKPESPRE